MTEHNHLLQILNHALQILHRIFLSSVEELNTIESGLTERQKENLPEIRKKYEAMLASMRMFKRVGKVSCN